MTEEERKIRHRAACKRYDDAHREKKRIYKKGYDAKHRKAPQVRICPQCQKQFVRKIGCKKQGRFCSRKCQQQNNNNLQKKPVERTCICGNTFITTVDRKGDALYCSNRCTKRHNYRVYRTRMFGGKYEPVSEIKVFERDQWTCQHCAIITPRLLMGTFADDSPEMDHILPLSKGGDHTYANTQCLCRKCNRYKWNLVAREPKLQTVA